MKRDVSIQRLLGQIEAGDRAALDELFSRLYEELTDLAHRHRELWHGNHTLNTTALIHEAYLRFVDRKVIRAEDRSHFLAIAAKAMRRILINYALAQRTLKRGGDAKRVSVDEAELTAGPGSLSSEQADELVALEDALKSLEQTDPRRSQVVECRFFGGMTVEETAAAMSISPRTVKRDWAVAQAWLQRRMGAQNA